MKYDVEYVSTIYITARNIEAGSYEEAVEAADTRWRGKYPVVTEPSETAPWLSPDDIHVSKDWEVNYDSQDEDDDDEQPEENQA